MRLGGAPQDSQENCPMLYLHIDLIFLTEIIFCIFCSYTILSFQFWLIILIFVPYWSYINITDWSNNVLLSIEDEKFEEDWLSSWYEKGGGLYSALYSSYSVMCYSCSVLCSFYSILCSSYSVLCSSCSELCSSCCVLCSFCSIMCSSYSVLCSSCSLRCSSYSILCSFYSVLCSFYI